MIETHVSSPIRSASASGPMRMREAELRDRVDRLGLGDAFHERVRRLVDERHEDAVRDEAGEIVRLSRRLAEILGERDDRRSGLVGGLERADHLDELQHGHRIEEVHPDDLLRTAR